MHHKLTLAHNLCSALQNGSRARLQRISVPSTSQHANILSLLLSHGFISSFTRGTTSGPDPAAFLSAPVAQRQLWVDLKYRGDQPVMRNVSAVSKPSLRVNLTPNELAVLHTGKMTHAQRGLVLGEICIVRGPREEYFEGREALRAKLESAEVLCRISS